MPYRKATLRKMPPHTRKVARLLDELESAHRRLKYLIPAMIDHENWRNADAKRRAALERGEL